MGLALDLSKIINFSLRSLALIFKNHHWYLKSYTLIKNHKPLNLTHSTPQFIFNIKDYTFLSLPKKLGQTSLLIRYHLRSQSISKTLNLTLTIRVHSPLTITTTYPQKVITGAALTTFRYFHTFGRLTQTSTLRQIPWQFITFLFTFDRAKRILLTLTLIPNLAHF